ncbi:MAG: hypothetical protein RL708_2208 [Bacteroidota bacterium]|jgi:thioredoxin-related protein
MIRFFILILLFFSGLQINRVFAQAHPDSKAAEPPSLVKWIDFKTAFEANKKVPKPFLIDVYTDWCGWCKHMMKTTYSNPAIAEYINNYFYAVKYNAETKDTIYFKDSMYVNHGTGPRPIHDLAIQLLGNRQSYPTTVFMFNDLKNQAPIPGYLDEKQIEPVLLFFVEMVYMNCPYEDFNEYFQKAFIDTTKLNKKFPLKKYTFAEAEKLSKTAPRKWLININTEWCNSCRTMNKAVLTDTLIADYINKNYYYIDFNAQQKDSIRFLNYTYLYKETNGSMPVHELAPTLTGGSLVLPSLVVLDESMKRLDVVQRFLVPKMLNQVLHYYGDDAYKTKQWTEFRDKFYSQKK